MSPVVADCRIVAAYLRMAFIVRPALMRGSLLLLIDVSLYQRKEPLVKRRVLDRLATHHSENLRGAGGHRECRGPDAHARRLLHLLQPAVLALGGDEHDAAAVAVIRAGRLQVVADVQFRVRLEVTRAGHDPRLVRSIEHVALTQQCAFHAPAHGIPRTLEGAAERCLTTDTLLRDLDFARSATCGC